MGIALPASLPIRGGFLAMYVALIQTLRRQNSEPKLQPKSRKPQAQTQFAMPSSAIYDLGLALLSTNLLL